MRYFFAAGVFAIAAIFSAGQIIQFYEGAAASQSGHTFLILGVTASIAGILAASVVLWEAIFYPIARISYRDGDWATGTISLVILLIAIGYTFTGDFETNVTGRADKVAERHAVVDNRATLKSEIEATSAQRNTWKTIVEQGRLSTAKLRELNQRIDQANSRIDELSRKMMAAPVNAGGTPASEFLADHIGQTIGFWAGLLLFFKLAFPALMRAFAWEFALRAFGILKSQKKAKAATVMKATPLPVFEPISLQKWETVKALSAPAAVTELAIALPAPVTEVPFLPEPVEVEAVTAAADPASEPVAETAPVTPPKRMTKKQRDLQKLFPEVSASVPQIHLPIIKVDHLQEALDAVIDEGRSGHLLSSAIGTKRVNAVLKRSGVPLISKEKFDKLVRERCRIRGVRVDSLVGRQLRFEDDETAGKKGSTRLGKNRASSASIPA